MHWKTECLPCIMSKADANVDDDQSDQERAKAEGKKNSVAKRWPSWRKTRMTPESKLYKERRLYSWSHLEEIAEFAGLLIALMAKRSRAVPTTWQSGRGIIRKNKYKVWFDDEGCADEDLVHGSVEVWNAWSWKGDKYPGGCVCSFNLNSSKLVSV